MTTPLISTIFPAGAFVPFVASGMSLLEERVSASCNEQALAREKFTEREVPRAY
jgi:hypothetical protein